MPWKLRQIDFTFIHLFPIPFKMRSLLVTVAVSSDSLTRPFSHGLVDIGVLHMSDSVR